VEHLWWSDFWLTECISNAEVTYIYELRFTSFVTYADRKFRPLRKVYLRYKSENFYRRECHS